MTAEIAILNSEAVALAADSAATARIGTIDKTSTSANKIFALSDYHPVGIMVYGLASFMGIPWETIIKHYRATALPVNGFDKLEQYADDFLSFLSYENITFHKVAEANYIGSFVDSVLYEIRNSIVKAVKKSAEEGEDINDDMIRETNKEIIRTYHNNSRGRGRFFPKRISKSVMQRYMRGINKDIDGIFEGFEIQDDLRLKLYEILENVFARFLMEDISCGIIITGFGEKEFTPSLTSYEVEGILRYKSRNRTVEKLKYEVTNSADQDVKTAIIPFAQKEMVYRFMDGVDPIYRDVQVGLVDGILGDFSKKVLGQLKRYNKAERDKIKKQLERYSVKAATELVKNMSQFVKTYFSDPTVDAVSRLPRNELALMAESLVYLTSLKRKISQDP